MVHAVVTIYKSLVFEFPCLTDAQPHYPTKGLLFGEGLVHVVIQMFLCLKLVLDGVLLGVFSSRSHLPRNLQYAFSISVFIVSKICQCSAELIVMAG